MVSLVLFRKKVLLALVCSLIVFGAAAEEVPEYKAHEVAVSFMELHIGKKILRSEITIFQHDSSSVFTYVVNFEPQGWVLLSADDRMPAILAYSDEGAFNVSDVDKLPFYFWFADYSEQIKISLPVESQVHPSWKGYYTSVGNKTMRAVEPIIQTKWNQNSPWNMYCPVDSNGPGGHALAGCVAVATAQCMMVHKHPTKGYGEHSYTHSTYGTQYANFGATSYQWDSMHITIPNKHIALLLRHVGVAVSMNYSHNFSGAYSSNVPFALKTYFDYSNSTQLVQRSSYSETDWISLLTGELENGRAIYYAGNANNGEGGHAFNIDGVNESGYFHVNWGWSGSYNGYYLLNSLTPYSGANYSFNQEAIVGIMPRSHSPYDIALSSTSVKENMPSGTVVGAITVYDETPNDVHQLKVSGIPAFPGAPTQVPFTISDKYLITTDTLSYNQCSSYRINITATDSSGNEFEKAFLISVLKNTNGLNALIDDDIHIFNAGGGAIHFTINNNSVGTCTIMVYGMNGQLVESKSFLKLTDEYSGSLTLSRTGCVEVYLVVIRTKNGHAIKKILFQ